MIKSSNNPNSNIPFWELDEIIQLFYKDMSNYNKILIKSKVITTPVALYDYLFTHGCITREVDTIVIIIPIDSLKNCNSTKVKFVCACAMIDDFKQLKMTFNKLNESPWISLINENGGVKQTISISFKTTWHI